MCRGNVAAYVRPRVVDRAKELERRLGRQLRALHRIEPQRLAEVAEIDDQRAGGAPFERRAPAWGCGTRDSDHGQASDFRYSAFAAKVLQVRGSPDRNPVWNQFMRCSALPCVNASGTT